jgi:hypothetical protein
MSLSTVPTDQARREAAEWFARLNKLDVPLADMQAWKLWLDAPGNKAAYDEVDAFWRKSEALEDDPDIKAAVASALGRATPTAPAAKPRRRGLAAALAVGVVAAVAGGYALWAPKVYSTGVGEQRTIQLADGSTVVLDTDSQVAVRLTGARARHPPRPRPGPVRRRPRRPPPLRRHRRCHLGDGPGHAFRRPARGQRHHRHPGPRVGRGPEGLFPRAPRGSGA